MVRPALKSEVVKGAKVLVKGYGRCLFEVKAMTATRPDPFHLAYAPSGNDPGGDYGWVGLEEILIDTEI